MTTEWDSLNQPSLLIDPDDQTELSHTAAGNLVYSLDAEGREVKRTFDALGRVEEEFDPRGRKTLHLYDHNGNEEGTILTWLGHGLPSKVEREKGYDELDRLEYEIRAKRYGEDAQNPNLSPNTSLFILYEYDEVGNPTRVVYPEGRETTTDYDELNRPMNGDVLEWLSC